MQSILNWLEALAQQIPLTWFVFLGALVEEIVAPIPSPLVMTLAGSINASQGGTILFLLVLAVIGAVSKTVGSFAMYFIADKAEDIIIDRFGRYLGVSHSDTEGLGKYLSKGRDGLAIFLMRAIPIIPTAPVSVIAGLIKTDLKTYLASTFFGLIIRNMVYLYLGFTSVGAIDSIIDGFDSLEKVGYLVLSVIGGVAGLWLYRRRQQGDLLSMVDNAPAIIKKWFRKK